MYREEFEKIEKRMSDFKEECLGSVTTLFTNIQMKPLTIGNMVYYIVEYKGRYVPAYCYLQDYERLVKAGKEVEFLPIYDEDETHEFGWICFNDVVRILDVIRERIMKK